jgi:peptidoglycan glycosyltransferase
MALVASAVANNGIIMTPHVMQQITDDNGKVIKTFGPSQWLQATSPETAAVMRQAMLGVVQGGTGTAAQVPGFEVGGKTGTAQLDTSPPTSEGWFICFAGKPGQQATVAVAVVVEGTSKTGGEVAAPIAKQLLQKVLELQG